MLLVHVNVSLPVIASRSALPRPARLPVFLRAIPLDLFRDLDQLPQGQEMTFIVPDSVVITAHCEANT